MNPNDIPALDQFRFPGHWKSNEARGGYCSLACIGGIAHDANTGADARITSYDNAFCGAPEPFSSCIDSCTLASSVDSNRDSCGVGCDFWRRTEFDPFSPFSLAAPEGDDTSFDVKGASFGTSDFRIAMDLTGMGRSISEGERNYGVSFCAFRQSTKIFHLFLTSLSIETIQPVGRGWQPQRLHL